MSVPCGVPNSCSNRSAGSAVACGRNEKMPPPSLSTTTIAQVDAATIARRDERVGVVHERDVADEGDRRRAGRAPDRARSTRRRRCRWRRGWRARGRRGPPNHSRSRTGIDDATTSSASAGSDAATTCATPGSVSGSSAAERRRRSPSSARFSACRQRAAHVVPVAPRQVAESVDRATRARRRGRDRSTPGPPTWTTIARRSRRSTGRAPSTPAAGRCARRPPASGRRRTPVAEQGVERRHRGRQRSGAATSGRRAPAIPSPRRAPRCASTGTPPRPPATITPRWRSTSRRRSSTRRRR